ncbi:MAG TPA: hypothetical protein VIY73_05735 [Polyangiaceae bacterium]
MSTTHTMPTKAAALASMQAVIDGLQKHFPDAQFTLGNVTYTTPMLVELFESLIAAITKANGSQAIARDDVAAMHGVLAQVDPVYLALTRNLRTTYGAVTQTLADFGIKPTKARTPLTVEQLAAAQAKAKATRAARGTASKKQKAAITGNVTGVTVTPVTAATVKPATSK